MKRNDWLNGLIKEDKIQRIEFERLKQESIEAIAEFQHTIDVQGGYEDQCDSDNWRRIFKRYGNVMDYDTYDDFINKREKPKRTSRNYNFETDTYE